MNRPRLLRAVVLVAATAWACTEAGIPTAGGGAVAIDLVPRFQVGPNTFTSPPIDRIVLRAREAATSQSVGVFDQPVSPTASQWALDLAIDLGSRTSMSVLVTIQLYSGSQVTWSGRLGPVTVTRGTSLPPQGVNVYRGPLSNLDVLSVAIGSPPSQMQVGASTTLTASTTLVAGSTATPQIFWTTTDPTVATVSQQGTTVTLDAVGTGSVDVIAAAGPAYDEFTLQVVAVPPAGKTWVGGDAAGPTDWGNPANWSPPGAPTSSDDVLVDGSSFDPVLSTDATVASITVGSNTVDLGNGDFTVTGNVNAGPNGFVNGFVIVTGPGTILEGSFDRLDIDADRALSGDVTTLARLTVYGGNLDVNGHDVTAPSLLISSAGRLVMTNAASVVTISGTAEFRGADLTGFLTAGTLRVGGSFLVSGTGPTFAATGAHLLELFGTGSATLTVISTPGPSVNRMWDVLVSNPAGVTFSTGAHVSGDLDVTSGLTIPVGTTTTVEGVLRLASGSSLVVNGTLTAAGGCVDNGATITGSGTHPCGSPPAGPPTWVGGDASGPRAWENPNNWNPAGVPTATDDVVIPAASNLPVLAASTAVASIVVQASAGVDLGGNRLTVTGDVDAGGNGITNGTVSVEGSGSVLQGTVGTLTVTVDRALTGNTIMLGDLNIADATLDTNGQVVSVSGNLTVDGPNGLLVMTSPTASLTVFGDALFNGGDHTGQLSDGFLSVGGDFHATDASPGSFAATGSHVTAFVASAPQSVIFEIPGPNAQRLQEASVAGPGGSTFVTSATVTGDLQVNSAALMTVPLGVTVGISGTLTLLSGSSFHVDGTVTAAGGCVDNGATISGTGTQPCGNPTPGTKVWVGGDSADPTGFANGANWSPVGVPTSVDYVIIRSTQFTPQLGQNRIVAGLEVQLGAQLDLGGLQLSVTGDAIATGGVLNGLTTVSGSGLFEGIFDALRVEAPRALTGNVTMASDLNAWEAVTVGPFQLTVGGDLFVENQNGRLVMTDQNSVLVVSGNASFDGASSTGSLTAGAAGFYGDFSAGSTHSTTSFHATGTFVYILGTIDQTISLSSPTTQRFRDVYVYQGGQGAATLLASDIQVDGELFSGNSIFRSASPGATIHIRGTANLDVVQLDGVPVRLQSTVAIGSHALDNLTFTNMPPTSVQLFIEVPGGGVNNPLFVNSPVFLTPPSGGGFYLEAVDNNVGDPDLYVELLTPTPTGQTTTYKQTGVAKVIWP